MAILGFHFFLIKNKAFGTGEIHDLPFMSM